MASFAICKTHKKALVTDEGWTNDKKKTLARSRLKLHGRDSAVSMTPNGQSLDAMKSPDGIASTKRDLCNT